MKHPLRFRTGVAIVLVAIAFAWAGAAQPQGGFSLTSLVAPAGRGTAEDAATDLFRACVRKSPMLFTDVRQLGVCEGPVDTLNRYAECLHLTTYRSGETSLTVYDLPKRMKDETARVVASGIFSEDDVERLSGQFMSTYYCEELIMALDVAAENDDGNEYRTRLVVAQVDDRWYAIPRCRSSRSFYEIADGMTLPEPEPEEAA